MSSVFFLIYFFFAMTDSLISYLKKCHVLREEEDEYKYWQQEGSNKSLYILADEK